MSYPPRYFPSEPLLSPSYISNEVGVVHLPHPRTPQYLLCFAGTQSSSPELPTALARLLPYEERYRQLLSQVIAILEVYTRARHDPGARHP
jgi:hypothetical protein